jgi:excinuclease ABC subunit C
MASSQSISSSERIDLTREPVQRRTPEAFLESFDVSRVSTSPGCYIMSDDKGKPIYVGKAKNLRARLRQYLNETDSRYSIKFLMRRVAHIELLVTTSEKEALLLENSLIKQYRPRYNIRLKDDKTYVSLRLNLREDFPRITVVRRYKKDGARYFGPYTSAQSVRETLRMIRRIFPLRLCSDHVLHNRTRPCLYYQMKQCTAPCVGLIDREAYHEIVAQVVMLLEGRAADVEKSLQEQIAQHAEKLDFEKAAAIRDRLYAMQRTIERQRTVAVPGAEDRDIVGFYSEGRFTEIQVIFFRGGKMVGGRAYSFEQCEMPIDELLSSFLVQYSSQIPTIPTEILVPVELEDASALEEVLSENHGVAITVRCPQRGDKRALVELAVRNAERSFHEKQLAEQANLDLIEQVRQTFKLSKPPGRIECFDVSTLQGSRAVGSMVTFEGGLPNKSRYRRFAIRTVEGQDDYAMLREILMRRFKRGIEENDLPDLVVIDGGKGQLGVAQAAFEDLGIDDLPALGMAKSRSEGKEHSPERFFIPGRANPIVPPQHGPVVQFMVRLRDEAHRFAITYHRKKRKEATLRTSLTSIPGVGPNRARTLLMRLGSIAGIRSSSVEEIAALPGFSDALAKVVLRHLEQRGCNAEGVLEE